jgi:hypothetical protein
MPFHDFIDVRVTVNGHPLQEYLDPDGGEAGGDQLVKYIEATVDQRFEVFIRWCPGFQLKHASNLVHKLCLDGLEIVPPQPIERKGLPAIKNILNAEQSFVYRNVTTALAQGQTGMIYYKFGALEIGMLPLFSIHLYEALILFS